jgi:tetratricopeptide (TPR) repeat protein
MTIKLSGVNCVTLSHSKQTVFCIALYTFALLVLSATDLCCAQTAQMETSRLQGHVRDSHGIPAKNASVSLKPATEAHFPAPIQTTLTDAAGAYVFTALPPGIYTLHAELKGSGETNVDRVILTEKETKTIDLEFGQSEPSQQSHTQAPEFYDEPTFTVAGVTQPSNSGGHGSDTVLRTTEALAKATVALGKESPVGPTAPTSAANEASLRDAIAHNPENFDAYRQLAKFLADTGQPKAAMPYLKKASSLSPRDPALHHMLGDLDEKLDNPLDAVREYQRAADLDPSESNLFDWGAELLAHGALEPATELFAKGNHQFPHSTRMLIALGVAWYARGSYQQATHFLENASDLDPENPTPYLFLERMQSAEGAPPTTSVERLRRFAQLQPDNPLANYYYAVALWRQSASAPDSDKKRAELSAQVESLLKKAVRLDPNLGPAYLQLGILYSQRTDLAEAISAYQQAVEYSPKDDETLAKAHYRLAQLYQRTDDKKASKQELELYESLNKKIKQQSVQERQDIQQFVISSRPKDSSPHSPDH